MHSTILLLPVTLYYFNVAQQATPNLAAVMKIMGKSVVIDRLNRAKSFINHKNC